MALAELQLDGLPGPTHHYGGLRRGNLASQTHAGEVSHPRAAALQCLAKQRQVLELGLPVALVPPLPRPDLALLRAAGFSGADRTVVAKAAIEEPALLSAACSSAFMWCANLGTVVHERDGAIDRCRIVPANLLATPHRAREAGARARQLRRLLEPLVRVDDPLPATPALADEGAANHTRFHGADGRALHLFVHGRDADQGELPRKHPARQTRAAQAAVARLTGLDPRRTVHARQSPVSIDAGAFHADVVMVGAGDRLLVHAEALHDQAAVLATLRERQPGLVVREVASGELGLDQAVACYLFNSLLVRTAAGWTLVAPVESAEGPARLVVDRLRDEGFVTEVYFVDLTQSMHGGGGPACLRLRMPVTAGGVEWVPASLRLDPQRIAALEDWVRAHYRERLALADLADPLLIEEAARAQDALADLLGIDRAILRDEESA